MCLGLLLQGYYYVESVTVSFLFHDDPVAWGLWPGASIVVSRSSFPSTRGFQPPLLRWLRQRGVAVGWPNDRLQLIGRMDGYRLLLRLTSPLDG